MGSSATNLENILKPVQAQITTLTSKITGTISSMSPKEQTHLFVELSILAYCDQNFITPFAKQMGFDLVQEVNPPNQVAYVFSNETDLVISFRGTYNVQNLIVDADCMLVQDDILPGKVHKGFLQYYNGLCGGIDQIIDENQDKNIWVTGHSLGAALAAIAAVRSARRTKGKIAGVFNYGQPRIGNKNYISAINTPWFRWVNHFDIVPRVPLLSMGYRHAGKEFYIDSDGNIMKPGIFNAMEYIMDRTIGTLGLYGIEDHIIFNYRDAIIKDLS